MVATALTDYLKQEIGSDFDYKCQGQVKAMQSRLAQYPSGLALV